MLFIIRVILGATLLLFCQPLSAQCTEVETAGLSCLEAPLLTADNLHAEAFYCSTIPSVNPIPGLNPFCNGLGTSENSGFFQFYPGTSALSFLITPESCDTIDNGMGSFTGMQAAVFPACDFGGSEVCSAACQNLSVALDMDDLNPGELYVLVVDGCNGSVCSFGLEITNGELMSEEPTGGDPIIAGPSSICSNESAVFSITQLPEEAIIDWQIDSDLSVNIVNQGRIIEVSNWSSAEYDVCSSIQLDPPSGPVIDTCLNIVILEAPEIDFITGDTLLCPADELQIEVNGLLFDEVLWQGNVDQLSCINCINPTFKMGDAAAELRVTFTNNSTGCSEQYLIQIGLKGNEFCTSSTTLLNDENVVSVYPNPVAEILYLAFETPPSSISIYSSDGQMVRQSKTVLSSINVVDYPPGVYYILIKDLVGNQQMLSWVKAP